MPSDSIQTIARSMPPGSRWLVTGVAGFIGSHLLEALLKCDQLVVGLDNLSTGHEANLEDVRSAVSPAQWERFAFRKGDITRSDDVRSAVSGCDYVLHQAALGSVSLSMDRPDAAHAANVTGFVHLLDAARGSSVRRVVYASSCAVYGDCTELPAREERIGNPLSPYAVSKSMDEQYAAIFERCFGVISVGLRYFNVCGPRQDPAGAYAAVIPRWIDALVKGRPVVIFGDGETTRDFCPVENVVEANLRAALVDLPREAPRVFNVGLGSATSLNQLYRSLRKRVGPVDGGAVLPDPEYGDPRPGDVRHSFADIARARRWLGFEGAQGLDAGLDATVRWFQRGSTPTPGLH